LSQLTVRIAEAHPVLINGVSGKFDNRGRACDGGDRLMVSPVADGQAGEPVFCGKRSTHHEVTRSVAQRNRIVRRRFFATVAGGQYHCPDSIYSLFL
jgi:hypothetical protein